MQSVKVLSHLQSATECRFKGRLKTFGTNKIKPELYTLFLLPNCDVFGILFRGSNN
ncbi:hypothetical protein BH20ACI1_BH20ACI1_04160 [soil metagenome]